MKHSDKAELSRDTLCKKTDETGTAWREMGAFLQNDALCVRAYAPDAAVSLVGDFNDWNPDAHPLTPETGDADVWSLLLPRDTVKEGQRYKLCLRDGGGERWIPDPYARRLQALPDTASELCYLSGYAWRDAGWLQYRQRSVDRKSGTLPPVSVYRMSVRGWFGRADGGRYGYSELADELAVYAKQLGCTHVELDDVVGTRPESPLVVGAYAPDARYGTPYEFMAFVDRMHEAGVGVLLNLSDLRRQTNASRQARELAVGCSAFWAEQYHVDGARLPRELAGKVRDVAPNDLLLYTDTPDGSGILLGSEAQEGAIASLPRDESDRAAMRLWAAEAWFCSPHRVLRAGDEIDFNGVTRLERILLESRESRQWQLFAATLGHAYLQAPALYEDFPMKRIERQTPDGGRLILLKRKHRDGRTVSVILNTGVLPACLSWEETGIANAIRLFDTADERFGGRGGTHVEEAYVLLPPMSAVALAGDDRFDVQ